MQCFYSLNKEILIHALLEHNVKRDAVDFESLDDLSLYLNQLSNVAEQNQVRLGLANYNVEMTDEITKTGIYFDIDRFFH